MSRREINPGNNGMIETSWWRVWLSMLVLFVTCSAADEVPRRSSAVDPEHAAKMAKGLELFKKHVRPIFVGRCLKCHGGQATESDFNLTDRDKLMKGGAGGPSIVAGKSEESVLYKVVAHLEEPHMPQEGAKLADTDIAAIASWIDLGAPYDSSLAVDEKDELAWTRTRIDESRRDFWSFLPLQPVAPPHADEDSWSRTVLDRFVWYKAREKGVTPNEVASRRVLLRRAYYDLIGLPPPAEEVESFLQDPDPEAYSRLIDRLLASPHYGERWGRHWLDIARFAESHGFEQDYDRPYAYHYRDFVIRAFNSDMPYDQFVRWQLAGDEIEPANPLALMATGFLGAGVFPTQLTEKEFEPARYDELDDMVATTGTAILGLTVGCARCHDHKFDPIPAADYYRMAATFATTIRSEIEIDLDPEAYRRDVDAFERAHQPLVDAWKRYDVQELERKFQQWLGEPATLPVPESKWHILDFQQFESQKGASMEKLDDGSVLVTGENPKQDQYVFVAETQLRGITAIRLDALTHPSLSKRGPGRAQNGNFALSDFKLTVQPLDTPTAKPEKVKLSDARATHEQDTGHLSVKGSIDEGYESGWAVDHGGIGKDQSAVFDFEQPLEHAAGVRLTVELRFANNVQHSMGRPRLSVTAAAAPVAIEGELLPQHVAEGWKVLRESGPVKLNQEQRGALRRWFAGRDSRWKDLFQSVAEHESQRPRPRLTKVMITSEGVKPIPHHADDRGFPHFYPDVQFLKRGDTQQKKGAAPPGFLQVLMTSADGEQHWHVPPPADSKTSHRRRAMAEWITDPQYGSGHLMARVIVNRLWHHHFGRGIVSTPSDFGYQGQRPSHPELLEWLAGQLIQNGWRLKPIHKMMMTSAAYMQTSVEDKADAARDPENVYLWRSTPRRLEAEIIRDAMLAASGELDRTPFGPGSLEEGMKRRSIYFMIKRSRLMPMMQLFDAPEPLVGVGNRPSTTIAPQALMFMNNTNVRGYARALARRLVESRAPANDAIRRAYRATLSRDPSDSELEAGLHFFRRQSESYQSESRPDAAELAWADFCQVLFAFNEFVYVE